MGDKPKYEPVMIQFISSQTLLGLGCVGYVYVCVAGLVAGGVGAVVLAASGVAGDEFAPWRLASYSEWPFNLHLTGTNVLAHRLK